MFKTISHTREIYDQKPFKHKGKHLNPPVQKIFILPTVVWLKKCITISQQACNNRGPSNKQWLILILAWVRSYIHCKVRDEINSYTFNEFGEFNK